MTVRWGEEGSALGGLCTSIPVAARRLRILPITLGSVMYAMMRMIAPPRGPTRGSTSERRWMSGTHRRPPQGAGTPLGDTLRVIGK